MACAYSRHKASHTEQIAAGRWTCGADIPFLSAEQVVSAGREFLSMERAGSAGYQNTRTLINLVILLGLLRVWLLCDPPGVEALVIVSRFDGRERYVAGALACKPTAAQSSTIVCDWCGGSPEPRGGQSLYPSLGAGPIPDRPALSSRLSTLAAVPERQQGR